MLTKRFAPFVCALLAGAMLPLAAQTHHAAASATSSHVTDVELKARITAFLNRSLGWQSLDKMEVESISAPDASGLRTVKVLLAKGTAHQEGTYLITADDKEIIEGEASPLSADPWAATRAKIDLRGAPATGAADAPVTIVEFSDLECPFCKEEAAGIAQLMQDDPGKARIVFKYFPLTSIHPWSMQAAKAAVCVSEQNPAQFWNFEKTVFEAQDAITTANAAQRLEDFATESGAKPAAYRACIANPATEAKVNASIANGKELGVTSTPTLFINGRVIPGAVKEDQLKLLVDHEATFHTADAGLATSKVAGKQCGECKALPPIKH